MIKTLLNKFKIDKAAKAISQSKKTFILTGAGISTSAGVPAFRGSGGLWTYEELQFLTAPQSWVLYPHKCWIAYEEYRKIVSKAQPTPAHYAIKALQDAQPVVVATTNVDSLHFKTGTVTYEIHGCLEELRCIGCKKVQEMPIQPLTTYPTCRCTAWMRHDVVLFGEEVRHVRETDIALETSDVVIFVGSSGAVTDIGEMATWAQNNGKFVIDINTEKTPASYYADLHIKLHADEALTKIVQKIYKLRRQK